MRKCTEQTVPNLAADTSYGMGWFVGPVNGLPAVFHQGETFTYHANIVLLPDSDEGVVILMNAENSVDLFTRGRVGAVASGVASMLDVKGSNQPTPPSRAPPCSSSSPCCSEQSASRPQGWYRSIRLDFETQASFHRTIPAQKTRIVVAMLTNLGWALLVLVLLPKQLGSPL